MFHQFRREMRIAQERAEAAISLTREQILCLSTGSQQVAVGKLLFHELSIDYYGGENP
jgi:hypothetical protein